MNDSIFNRQLVTLMSGTSVAQLIPLIVSPILTRIYSPEDFGVLALFSAITAILSIACTAKYELAIVLSEDEKDSIILAILAFFISVLFSIVIFILIFVLHDFFVEILNNPAIASWLYLIPIVSLFMGLFNVLNYLNLNYEKYGTIAKANVYRSLSLVLGQVGFGFLMDGSFGLIIGKFISYVVGSSSMLNVFLHRKKVWVDLSQIDFKRLAKKYIQFPKFSLPALLANSVTQNINNFFISILYTSKILGFYGLIYRVLDMPVNFIGNAFSQVFLKKASERKKHNENVRQLLTHTFIRILFLAIIIFVPLYLIIEDMFVFVFGENWQVAGSLAKILLPLFFARFVIVPLSTILIVFEKQKQNMIWQLCFLAIIVSCFIVAYKFAFTIEVFLRTISLSLTIHYLILLGIVYVYSNGATEKTVDKNEFNTEN